jgi:hypothetical protein
VGDEDDLKINTLHRFTKHSPNLILQEYSHCEVPAGCGGVILRWSDRAQGVTAQLRVSIQGGGGKTWLDGAEAATSIIQLAPGRHAIAVQVSAVSAMRTMPVRRLVAITAQHREREGVDLLAGAAWTMATAEPAAAWTAIDFDAGWDAVPRAAAETIAALDERVRRYWEGDRVVYELPLEPCWLRLAFDVEDDAR